jgi:DeoR family transcriptional regulator, fructose operon transcriptional repressor
MSTEATVSLAAERHQRIRDLVRGQRVARVDGLAEALQVSAATIRRDLEDLERHGVLQRVHGGAVAIEGSLEEPPFDDRTSIAEREKDAIAEAALPFVRPKDTVYLDGGSTVLSLARRLLPFTLLTVVTNSLRVAQIFGSTGPRMILVGGECRRLSQTLVGPLSRHVLGATNFDLAFMGTVGISVRDGLTTTDPAEAFTKELAMARARRVALLTDSAKFGKASFVRFASAEDLDVLITDHAAPPAELDGFRQADVRVITVQSEPKGTT